MSESDECAELVKQFKLKVERAWFFKHVHSQDGRSGIPDLIGCIDGRMIAFEVKLINNVNYTQMQQMTIRRMQKAGCFACGLVVNPGERTEKYALDLSFDKNKGNLNKAELNKHGLEFGSFATMLNRLKSYLGYIER